MNRAIIIVAGGKGLRMGGDIPKQFLLLQGRPILMHTIERFHDYDPHMQIVVVLPTAQQDYWEELCRQYSFAIPHTITAGGEQRFHSVKNGLLAVSPDCDVIGVHDGVRPFVSTDTIRRCYQTAESQGTAIPVVPVVDSMRRLCKPTMFSHHTSTIVDREDYRLVQTPQVFSAQLLRNAYEQPFTPRFTDDASVIENLGYPVTLVDGNRDNIKITTPEDLISAL